MPVTVNWVTANGSAKTPGDYVSAHGTLTFAPGITSRHADVYIKGDKTKEPNETLTVTISNPHNATITDSKATATITNDDH